MGHSPASDPFPTADAAGLAGSPSAVEQFLVGLSERMSAAVGGDFGEAVHRALAEIGRFTAVSSCFLFEFNAENSVTSKLHEWHDASVPSTRSAFAELTPQNMPTLFPRAAAGEVLRVDRMSDLGGEAAGERRIIEGQGVGGVPDRAGTARRPDRGAAGGRSARPAPPLDRSGAGPAAAGRRPARRCPDLAQRQRSAVVPHA